MGEFGDNLEFTADQLAGLYPNNFFLHQSPATNDQYGGRYATYTIPGTLTNAEWANQAASIAGRNMPMMPGISIWDMAKLLQSPIPVQLESSGAFNTWINPETHSLVSSGRPVSPHPMSPQDFYWEYLQEHPNWIPPNDIDVTGWSPNVIAALRKRQNTITAPAVAATTTPYSQYVETNKSKNSTGTTSLPAYNSPTQTTVPKTTQTLANAYNRQNTFQPEKDYNPFPNYYAGNSRFRTQIR